MIGQDGKIKGKFGLRETIGKVPVGNLFISEMSLAELKFGVANRKAIQKNQEALDDFLSGVQVLPNL